MELKHGRINFEDFVEWYLTCLAAGKMTFRQWLGLHRQSGVLNSEEKTKKLSASQSQEPTSGESRLLDRHLEAFLLEWMGSMSAELRWVGHGQGCTPLSFLKCPNRFRDGFAMSFCICDVPPTSYQTSIRPRLNTLESRHGQADFFKQWDRSLKLDPCLLSCLSNCTSLVLRTRTSRGTCAPLRIPSSSQTWR